MVVAVKLRSGFTVQQLFQTRTDLSSLRVKDVTVKWWPARWGTRFHKGPIHTLGSSFWASSSAPPRIGQLCLYPSVVVIS